MGEEKENLHHRRLLVRLRVPSPDKMVVQLELGREYLGRCLKLMLICGKIKQTMRGAGEVVVESHGHLYITMYSTSAIQRLVSLARVKDWKSFSYLWVPEGFYIGECRVMAG